MSLVDEARDAVQAARRKVSTALLDETCKNENNDICRHLSCLNYALMAAEFTAAEAVNAALYQRWQLGGPARVKPYKHHGK